MTQLLAIIGLAAINLTVLSLFVHTLHRIFATGPDDMGEASALLAAILAFIPIVQGARLQTSKIQTLGWHKNGSHKIFLLGLNAAAIVGVLSLWLLALPWLSERNYNKGMSFNEQGKLNKAIEHFNQSIYQHADNPAALLSLAILHEEIKDEEKAKQFYVQVIRHETAPVIALNNLARLYINSNEHDEAIALLLRAQTHLWQTAQPNDTELNLRQGVIAKNLAWAYWTAKDTTLAAQAIREADSALALAGAASNYPEIYCLKAILLPQTQARDLIRACEMGMAEKDINSLDIGLLRQARKHSGD